MLLDMLTDSECSGEGLGEINTFIKGSCGRLFLEITFVFLGCPVHCLYQFPQLKLSKSEQKY